MHLVQNWSKLHFQILSTLSPLANRPTHSASTSITTPNQNGWRNNFDFPKNAFLDSPLLHSQSQRGSPVQHKLGSRTPWTMAPEPPPPSQSRPASTTAQGIWSSCCSLAICEVTTLVVCRSMTKRFSGLMSRWQIIRSCRYWADKILYMNVQGWYILEKRSNDTCKASAKSWIMSRATPSVYFMSVAIASNKSPPWICRMLQMKN